MERALGSLLNSIGLKYATDKSTLYHAYTEIYDRIFGNFRLEPVKFLEIGVYRGASIKMWEEYFPNAEIYGIDSDSECKRFANDRTRIFIGDQCDESFLEEVGESVEGGFDVILDDGGHVMNQQITSFKVLWKFLKPGSVYVVEDLQTSYMVGFGGGYRKSGTTIEFLKDLVDDMNLQDQELESLAGSLGISFNGISSLHFYEKLCFIFKKR